ncbi:MAG: transposase [Chitinophagaceae bacterium]|nr:transposase [Anaerolineae bacterium]
MKSENEWVLERIKLYQLIRAQPDWSLRQYAQELGHDPKWVRKWAKRIKAAHSITIDLFKSQSRAPKTLHTRIGAEAKQLVSELRQQMSERFHRKAGAKTIAYGLKEYAKQHEVPFFLPKSLTTITRILHETGWIRAPRPILHEPVTLPSPMEEWEMDFGEIWLPDEGMCEFFVVVDRGTSRLVYVEASRGYNAVTALEAVLRLFVLYGLPQRLRFDRDVRLWGAWTRDSYPSPFIRFLRVIGVEDVVCPPRRPDLKPFVERCIGTLKYEWFARHFPATFADALEMVEQFPHYYNDERPHQGKACQNQPPSVAFPVLPPLPQLPEQVAPDNWLKSVHGRVYRRRVNSDGTIQIDRHTYSIGTRYTAKLVPVHVDANQKSLHVTLDGQVVKTHPVQGLYGSDLPFWDYFKHIQTEAQTIERHRLASWARTGDSE